MASKQPFADRGKIKQLLHQRCVVCDRVDDPNVQFAAFRVAGAGQIHQRQLGDSVAAELLAGPEYGFGYLFGGLATARRIELQAEIAIRSAGIVAGSQYESGRGPVLPDYQRCSRRRQQAVLSDDHFANAVCRCDCDDGLYRCGIVVPAVTADDQACALRKFQRIEDRLDEAFEIVRLPEHADLLAQPGRAGPLILEGRAADMSDVKRGHDHRLHWVLL